MDETAPTLTIATIAGDNILNLAEAAGGLTIDGTAPGTEDGQVVTVQLINGGGATVDTITDLVANTAWSASLDASQATSLADGLYTVTANVTDAAGNPAPQAIHSLTIDKTPPSVTIGTIASDDILNLAEAGTGFSISGTAPGAEDGEVVTATIVDAVGTTLDTVSGVVSNGAWSASLSPVQAMALGDGSDTVRASVSDIAGNPAATAIRTLAVDQTAPGITIGSVAGDDILNLAEAAAGFSIGGTASGAEDGQVVTVGIVDGGGTTADTVTGIVANAVWSDSVSAMQATALVSGLYTLTANVSDVAGNPAIQATRSLTVDETIPSLTIGTIAGDNVLNLAEATAGLTISGTALGAEDGRSSPSPWSTTRILRWTPSLASSRTTPGLPASAPSRRRPW